MKKDKSSVSNKEYIRNKFDEDGIKAPASLSEDSIMSMLDKAEEKAGSKEKVFKTVKKRPRIAKGLALAACAVIAVFGISGMYYSGLFAPNTNASGGELYSFKNESEIKQLIMKMDRTSPFDFFRMKSNNNTFIVEESEEMAFSESSDAASGESEVVSAPRANGSTADSGAAKSASGAANHSETYLQVEEVDEADIVKNDGKYIYFVNEKREVVILEAGNGKTSKVATVGSSGIENYIHKIFLKGDTLITVGMVYDGDDGYTAVVSYDIKDRRNPKVISEFRQSGSDIIASRMVGSTVYLVTNVYAYNDFVVPKCTIDGEYRKMDCRDISCVPSPKTASYIILSAVDVSSGKEGKSKTKAVFGATQDIYCNDRNLYTVISEWDEKTASSNTRIVRASLDGLNIKFNGTATVRGYINNQFSMDEHDGYFRIATTSERSGMDVNNLYVMDSSLKEVGSITGFARNESIKAVRFMGDKAYVITYEAIDPLFIMDLSDPENPRIEGEVKIDGFSSLLLPLGNDRLLGIGHATGDNGYGGQYASGLKLALFDTSNPSEPKVLDSKEFKDMSSPAQSTHLALTVNKNRGYFAIPYEIWRYEDVLTEGGIEMIEDAEEPSESTTLPEIKETPQNEFGVLVFGTENSAAGKSRDKIKVFDQKRLADRQILRNVYIEDYIYGLDAYGEAYSFKPTV